MNGLSVLGTGRSVPGRLVTNDDFSRTLDTSDEWIRTRTVKTVIGNHYFAV